MPRPADLHVEALLRGQVQVPRFHRRDHRVDRAALESVHGRGPCAIDMPELAVAFLQFQRPPSSSLNVTVCGAGDGFVERCAGHSRPRCGYGERIWAACGVS